MAWPNPFRKRTGDTRDAWGFLFELTPLHPTPEEMEPMKYSYDVLAELAYLRLKQIEDVKKSSHPLKSPSPAQAESPPLCPKKDLYVSLRDSVALDDTLGNFWHEVNLVPSWVNWEQIARGQDCFYRYGGAALTGLAFQSLLGGMVILVVWVMYSAWGLLDQGRSASSFVYSETFITHHTDSFSETTQHILQCTKSLESIKPGGDGHASSIRVRLLHAAVRQRIMTLASQRPSYYDVEKWGVPINDLDSIATIATFSATLIFLSLPRQGIWMRQQEIEDYTALWRYVAYLTGTPTSPFETPSKSKRWMEILMFYEIRPTITSRILANNIVNCLQDQPPSYASRQFLEVNARWLNGNAIADELGLGRPGFYYWALMAGQCLLFMALIYTYRAVPYLDRRKVKALRKIFWQVIVESKMGLGEETTFEFKHIPDLTRTTKMEEALTTVTEKQGVEKRNFCAFVVGCSILSILIYIAITIGLRLVETFALRLV